MWSQKKIKRKKTPRVCYLQVTFGAPSTQRNAPCEMHSVSSVLQVPPFACSRHVHRAALGCLVLFQTQGYHREQTKICTSLHGGATRSARQGRQRTELRCGVTLKSGREGASKVRVLSVIFRPTIYYLRGRAPGVSKGD